jgi:hypothetical protein
MLFVCTEDLKDEFEMIRFEVFCALSQLVTKVIEGTKIVNQKWDIEYEMIYREFVGEIKHNLLIIK